jgi:nitroreductase
MIVHMSESTAIDLMMRRASCRSYESRRPSDDEIAAIVRAGMQAPFASQMACVLLSERPKAPFGAPLWWYVCADIHRLELFMAARGWKRVTDDSVMLLFAMQDAAYLAENMVIAAESLGLGSCYLGDAPFHADTIAEEFDLPPRVMPLVGLVMGYPAQREPPRPRYPLDYILHVGRYRDPDAGELARAMEFMDSGYLAQDYYRKARAKIPLEDGRPDPYDWDTYSWTEHISRKWGQWWPEPDASLLEQLAKRGFRLGPAAPEATIGPNPRHP